MEMRHWWNETYRRNPKYSGKNPVQDLLYLLQTPDGLIYYCNRTAVTTDRQLTGNEARPSEVLMVIQYDAVYCVNL
jgi:hypothetical protein